MNRPGDVREAGKRLTSTLGPTSAGRADDPDTITSPASEIAANKARTLLV
jgi:hypothetical protein